MLNILRVKYKPFDPLSECIAPSYATEHASGADLEALEDYELPPHSVTMIPTNIAVEIPIGYELQVRPRSGFSTKKHILVINSPGTIDADYRGEIKVALFNPGSSYRMVLKGQRFAQLVLAPVLKADFLLVTELSDTKRGSGGFGSTDKYAPYPGAQEKLFSEFASGNPEPIPDMPEGVMCAKCGDWFPALFSPACQHKPELEKGPIGMYHCIECGIMVLAGVPHPWLCASCNLEIESLMEAPNGTSESNS